MEKQAKISVVISCYNYGQYIKEAVDSAKKSTIRDVEIIVVDDGSDDPFTLEVLEGLLHRRIQLITQENKGAAGARNTGIKAAQGDYIVCLDADDFIHPRYLELASKVLDSDPSIGIATSWYSIFGLLRFVEKPLPYNLYLLSNGNQLHPASLFRKTAWQQVGGYDEKMSGYEDWELWIKIGEAGWGVAQIPEVLFFQRCHGGSKFFKSRKKHVELVSHIRKMHQDLYSFKMQTRLFFQWLSDCLQRKELHELRIGLGQYLIDFRLRNIVLGYLDKRSRFYLNAKE